MSQFRLPELGRTGQLQTFSPSVSNPTAMPVANNKRLEQILGVINTAGTVAAAYAQNRYYDSVNRRTRLGMASSEGQDAAAGMADQFATGTVPDDLLEQLQSASPEDLPQTIRQTVTAQAMAEVGALDLPDEEAKAWAEGYTQQVMRYALPWAKDLIETDRGVVAAGLSADLRRPGTTLADSYAGEGGWQQNPTTSNLGWRGYQSNVVVPAMQVMAADNDFAGVERLYKELSSRRIATDGTLAESGDGGTSLITPEIARIYNAAKKAHFEQRVDESKQIIGGAIMGGLDPDSREIAMDTVVQLSLDGGYNPQFARTFASAVDELMDQYPGDFQDFATSLLVSRDEDGGYRLPWGHPIRDILRQATSAPAEEMTEADRTRIADTIMLRGIAAQESPEVILKNLTDELGETALADLPRLRSLREKYQQSTQDPHEVTKYEMLIREAVGVDELSDLRGQARVSFAMGDISGSDYLSIDDQIESRSKRLPFDYFAFDETKRFDADLREAFFRSSEPLAIGGSTPSPQAMQAWGHLQQEARANWEKHVDNMLSSYADAAAESDQPVNLADRTLSIRQRIWRDWNDTRNDLIRRATELRGDN